MTLGNLRRAGEVCLINIPRFTAKFPLTYKIPLSYTLTVEKEILINNPGRQIMAAG